MKKRKSEEGINCLVFRHNFSPDIRQYLFAISIDDWMWMKKSTNFLTFYKKKEETLLAKYKIDTKS